MNQELFDSMREQMKPSPQVRAELTEKLAQPVKKRPSPWKRYGAVAACAALVIGAFPLYHAIMNPDSVSGVEILWTHRAGVPLHSYVTVKGLTGYSTEDAAVNDKGSGGEDGAGDQDMDMTPEDLEQAMLDVGYTQGEVDEYQSIGYQMTWAKWWKFVDGQRNSEGDAPFNLDSLKSFSQKELYVNAGILPAPNTGDLPGGAYVGDAPAQEEALQAIDKLAPHIRSHPDWYGGAYIDSAGTLIVCLVESQDPGDKSLELQVLEWTGNDRVGFTSGKYSLGYLLDLQKKVCDALYYDLGLGFSCGTNEELNRLELTLPEVTDEALVLLAELDPDDDAIYVQVGQRVSLEDTAGEDPAVHHVVPGGTTAPVPEDDNLIADEPYYDGAHYDVENLPEELPQKKQPAFVETDSVPEEDASTSCWFPEE